MSQRNFEIGLFLAVGNIAGFAIADTCNNCNDLKMNGYPNRTSWFKNSNLTTPNLFNDTEIRLNINNTLQNYTIYPSNTDCIDFNELNFHGVLKILFISFTVLGLLPLFINFILLLCKSAYHVDILAHVFSFIRTPRLIKNKYGENEDREWDSL